MDRVGVDVLLRSNGEVQSLEGKCPTAPEFRKQVKNAFVRCNCANILVELPCILDPADGRILRRSRISVVDPEFRRQSLTNAPDAIVQITIREVENRVSFTIKIRRNGAFRVR